MVHSETCNKVLPPNSMVGEVWDLAGREKKRRKKKRNACGETTMCPVSFLAVLTS